MANRYWVGGSDTWNTTAGSKWSTSSGGAGGAAVPTIADDVFFDANSGAVTVVADSSPSSCAAGNLDFTGFTGTFQLDGDLSVFGSLTLVNTMTTSGSGAELSMTSSSTGKTITFAGQTFSSGNFDLTFNGSGGGWTLQDDITAVNNITLTAGSFDANDNDITVKGTVNMGATSTRTLTMGNGTWTLSGSGTVWTAILAANLTLNAESSTIKLTNSHATASATFNGFGNTYNDFWNATTGTGECIIGYSNTFNDFKIDAGRIQHFTAGTTTTMSTLTAIGTAGNVITITSSTAATHTLSDTSGTNSVEYCNISYSTATGGATWEALLSNNNLNSGNNTGWIFGSSSLGTSLLLAFV